MYLLFDQSFVSSIIFHDHILSLGSGTSIQHNHLIVSSLIIMDPIVPSVSRIDNRYYQSNVPSINNHFYILHVFLWVSAHYDLSLVSSIFMQNHILHLVPSEVFFSWSVDCFIDNQTWWYFSFQFIERHSLLSVFCSVETHPRSNPSSGFWTNFHHEQSFMSSTIIHRHISDWVYGRTSILISRLLHR